MQIELSPRQRQTVGTAITILAACVILAAVGVIFWALAVFAGRFSNVFLPLAVAGIAALVFKPEFEWMRTRLRLPPVAALAGVLLSIAVPVVAFGWFFGALIVGQCVSLAKQIPGWWASAVHSVQVLAPQVVEFLERHSVLEQVTGAVGGSSGVMVKRALQVVGSGALTAGFGVIAAMGTLAAWVVTPVYFAFFMLAPTASTSGLGKFLPFLKEETRKDVVYLVGQFVDILVAFFRGQLIIAFLQGLLFATGFTIVGLDYGFIIGGVPQRHPLPGQHRGPRRRAPPGLLPGGRRVGPGGAGAGRIRAGSNH